MISFYAYYIYYGRDRACSYSNGYVRPHLNDFIRTLKRSFIFISLISSNQEFTFNVVILIDSCGVFVNYVFLYVRLFPLTYVYHIRYMIDW